MAIITKRRFDDEEVIDAPDPEAPDDTAALTPPVNRSMSDPDWNAPDAADNITQRYAQQHGLGMLDNREQIAPSSTPADLPYVSDDGTTDHPEVGVAWGGQTPDKPEQPAWWEQERTNWSMGTGYQYSQDTTPEGDFTTRATGLGGGGKLRSPLPDTGGGQRRYSPFDDVYDAHAGDLAGDDDFIRTVAAGTKVESIDWNPKARGDYVAATGRYKSHGLFQMHDAGAGAGWTDERRQDPNAASEKMVPEYAKFYKEATAKGLTGAERASYTIRMAERPLGYTDPNGSAARAYIAAYQEIGGQGWSPPANAAVAAPQRQGDYRLAAPLPDEGDGEEGSEPPATPPPPPVNSIVGGGWAAPPSTPPARTDPFPTPTPPPTTVQTPSAGGNGGGASGAGGGFDFGAGSTPAAGGGAGTGKSVFAGSSRTRTFYSPETGEVPLSASALAPQVRPLDQLNGQALTPLEALYYFPFGEAGLGGQDQAVYNIVKLLGQEPGTGNPYGKFLESEVPNLYNSVQLQGLAENGLGYGPGETITKIGELLQQGKLSAIDDPKAFLAQLAKSDSPMVKEMLQDEEAASSIIKAVLLPNIAPGLRQYLGRALANLLKRYRNEAPANPERRPLEYLMGGL